MATDNSAERSRLANIQELKRITAELLVESEGHELDKTLINDLFGPGVYIIRGKDCVLYVGSGKSVITRLSNPQHAKRGHIEGCYGIRIVPCRSEDAARRMEGLLIEHLKPLLNGNSGPRQAPRKMAESEMDSVRKLIDSIRS